MLTVIFGAGASYDSSPDYPAMGLKRVLDDNRLPLAKNLFSERFGKQAQQNEAALALIPRLRTAVNIEQELEAIIDSQQTYPPVFRQLLSIRYYIRDVIQRAQIEWKENYTHNVTSYHQFLDTVDRARYPTRVKEKIALITFNYDTLLDIAFSAVLREPLKTIDAYIKNETAYKIFKPHGSVDWLHEVTNAGKNTLDSAEKLEWTKNYAKGSIKYIEVADNKAFIQTEGEGIFVPLDHDYVPAIAIPTETKKTFEFPDEHRDEMIATIKETTSLLIIGWRGAEQHFLELYETNADPTKLKLLQIVSTNPKSASQIEQTLAKGGITCSSVRYSYKGFSEFVTQDLKSFLIEASHY